jgi:uncharacterized protein YndB with AHSA1/START domain
MSSNNSNRTPYDWSRFVKRVNVHAPKKKLYDAWATPLGLETWFLRKAIFTDRENNLRQHREPVLVGDNYQWYWHGYSDATAEEGIILEANGVDRIGFKFGHAGRVTVSVVLEGGETIVELVQDQIPLTDEAKTDFHLGCSTGWVFYLTNLKSVLEGGLDLRNKKEALKNLINA